MKLSVTNYNTYDQLFFKTIVIDTMITYSQ